jgi:beta-glucosidase/6-phospho-beta-glucosidase/beta-galactosidase
MPSTGAPLRGPWSARTEDALFEDALLAGFECSQHRLIDGRRLDVLALTHHDRLADADFMRLRSVGITTCREGVSWVAVEGSRGQYDFATADAILHAAERRGIRVVWDLMHFGWPDHVDVFRGSFPSRFGRYARAFATWFATRTDATPMIAPINEMSFLAWAGGDVGCMNPFESSRGVELKAQLVLATIEAIEAIRLVLPHARFLQPEPVIRMVPAADQPRTFARIACDNELQYQAWDMLSGRVWPRLGGHPRYLDVIGVNFYDDNQFTLDGTTVSRDDPRYTPFSSMLRDVWRRYGRPMIVSETGSEGDARASWLRYVADECVAAMREGCELHAVTLYPILNHPGWLDARHCHNGLWDYADVDGHRARYEPLADEIGRQAPRLIAERARMLAARAPGPRARAVRAG